MTDDFYIDADLVEASSLAHDMGHPPFGHSGERTLQELMKRRGGFEGNAQTLHLLCESIYQNESGVRGMQPTRALLDGVLKYKKLYTEFATPPLNHFIYDGQAPVRDWVFGGAKIPGPLMRGDALNDFKSVECQIMDWSDDAAYSLNDIVDGGRAGFLPVERVERWADGETIGAAEQRHLDTLFDALKRDRLERSEEHTSELQSPDHLVCRLLLEKKNKKTSHNTNNKKSKAKQRIRTLRGKYKHLDLMKGLIEARTEERQSASITRPAISARSLKI